MPKEILISVEAQEHRVAVLEQRRLEEYFVERTNNPRLVGSVWKGRVASVVEGIGAAFVDIGQPKNGFLYVSDVISAPTDELLGEAAEVTHEHRPERHGRHRHARIGDLVKVGQEILVQVVKDPLGTKGARLTTHISLPGRCLVFMPTDGHTGISKRIESAEERQRLREILKTLREQVVKEAGLIVRTAGVGHSEREFLRDAKYLSSLWQKIRQRGQRVKPPAPVHQEYDLSTRIMRDYLSDDVERIVIDSKEAHRKLQHFLSIIAPELRSKLHYHQGPEPLFMQQAISEEIDRLFDRKVELPSGGTIIIEPTEGLIAIDVNTSRFAGRRNLEETAFQVNCEAAEEIARQLRLRDLGGIIVIDFIDMDIPAHRRQMYQTLERALRRDRAKTNLVSFSELCVVEMTRQRMRQSMQAVSQQPCPYCAGRGTVKSPMTVAIRALRELRDFLRQRRQGSKSLDVELYVNPQVAEHLLKEDRPSILQIEGASRSRILVMADPNLHLEEIKIQPA